MDSSTTRVIGTAALISVGVGTLNSFAKHKRPPSLRFLIGSGAAYVILSAIGEGEPEVAKALAIAVATTVVLGDGGGVLSYLDTGEIDTAKRNAGETEPLTSSADMYKGEEVSSFTPNAPSGGVWPSSVAAVHEQIFRPDIVSPIPGLG